MTVLYNAVVMEPSPVVVYLWFNGVMSSNAKIYLFHTTKNTIYEVCVLLVGAYQCRQLIAQLASPSCSSVGCDSTRAPFRCLP